MLGAIVGDIVGSVYEWHNIKTKDFPLFRDDCFFTDDTIMTIAVAEAIMNRRNILNKDDFITAMKKYGRMYPNADYGGRFREWLFSDDDAPYNSWGNGSAMRISPVANFCKPDWDAMETGAWIKGVSEMCAAVTHNHPEGIKGAQAVADAIWYMQVSRERGEVDENSKQRLKKRITKMFGYDLSETLDEIRPKYKFDESCQGTVPPAIIAFLESTDFEDAIRNAISIGGDSDTLAAITGSIAEAAYGVPEWIEKKALSYLDKPLLDVYNKWNEFLEQKA